MKHKIYQGTTKTLYNGKDDNTLMISFDDYFYNDIKNFSNVDKGTSDYQHLAFHNKSRTIIKQQRIEIAGKGIINNSISSFIMEKLDMIAVPNHFIKKLNMRHQLVHFIDMIPLQIRINTLATDRYVDDFRINEGFVFETPMIDFRIKHCKLNNPPINESQIISFGWLSQKELKILKERALKVCHFLIGLFAAISVRLVECKLEFGHVFDGEGIEIMLADEISPDNCKLWDMHDNKKLCYEIIHDEDKSPSDLIAAYREIANRFNIS